MSAPTGTDHSDLRPEVIRALDQAGELIAHTSPDQAGSPTPCSEYDVAELIGHLHVVVHRIATVLAGEHFSTSPVPPATADWIGEWNTGRAKVDDILADDDCLSRAVTVPWGEITGAESLAMYLGELGVHAWDLAAATGQLDRLDPELAEVAIPLYRKALPREPRGGEAMPFDPVVEVGSDAGAYDRLVAWSGRDPSWR